MMHEGKATIVKQTQTFTQKKKDARRKEPQLSFKQPMFKITWLGAEYLSSVSQSQ